MYDAIRLEAGDSVSESIIQSPSARQAYIAWAAANLPPGDHTFGGDADLNGIPTGFEFAYGPLAEPFVLLQMQLSNGIPSAVLAADPNTNGASYTRLDVEAGNDLSDWVPEAALQESEVQGQRQWTPVTVESNLFFRASLDLQD